MATTFLNARIWPRLTKLARDSRQQCHVAVAYFGQGASKLLPLPAGSILVVDMSEGSVKEGQTSPTEVGNMLRRKVAVYSCRGLHAKAFVFGKTAVVGSANVSARSKNILIEAAIETTEPKTVRSCVQFVRDWCRKRITKRDVERLAPLYNPAGGRGGKYLAEREENHLRPLWAVALSRMDWDQEDTRQADRARPLARKEIGDRRQFRLEEFCWPGNDLTERLSERDMVLQVMSEPGKRVLIHPPSNVIRIQQYHVRNSKRMIVFLREPKKNRINLKRLVKRLEAPSKNLRKLKRCRLLKNPKLVGELLRLWRVPQTTEKG